MAWIVLLPARRCRIAWAAGLKHGHRLSRRWPGLPTRFMRVVSVVLPALALGHLRPRSGHAVWTGIGAVGTALVGILLSGESRELLRLMFIGLIVAGNRPENGVARLVRHERAAGRIVMGSDSDWESCSTPHAS
jgi:quaternary ammonium compound-resistance protein SugE